MLQQLTTDTVSTDVGVDEERLHMGTVDQHKTIGTVIFIDCNSQRCMGQKTTNFGINGLSIFGMEKVMGGVHGAPPKVNERGAIFRTRSAQCVHSNLQKKSSLGQVRLLAPATPSLRLRTTMNVS